MHSELYPSDGTGAGTVGLKREQEGAVFCQYHLSSLLHAGSIGKGSFVEQYRKRYGDATCHDDRLTLSARIIDGL